MTASVEVFTCVTDAECYLLIVSVCTPRMREHESILRTFIHYVHLLLCELSLPALSTCFYVSEIDQKKKIDQMTSRGH